MYSKRAGVRFLNLPSCMPCGLLVSTVIIQGGHIRQPCYYCTTTKKKMRGKTGHAQNILPVRAISRQGLFRSRDFDTSGQKAPLRWILRNFRLRMRRTYFRTGHVTDVTSGLVTGVISGHVTSGSSSSLLRKY